jgi:hypothetical protein
MQRSDKQDSSQVAGAASPYGDWSGYTAVNAPGTLPARGTFTKPLNPDHWQPDAPDLVQSYNCSLNYSRF